MYYYLVYAMWFSWAILIWQSFGIVIGICVDAMGGDGSVDGHWYWMKYILPVSFVITTIVAFIKDTAV